MSSIREVSSGIGAGGVLRSGIIAMIDLISTANGKAIGGLFERTDISVSRTYLKVLHDEGLETFWATVVSSLLAKTAAIVTPWVPEQVAIIPGKLIGETWHWLITSEQSTNREKEKKVNGNGKNGNESFFPKFFDTFVKRPSDFVLALCGLEGDKYDEKGDLIKEGKSSFIRYAISQLGIFGLAGWALKGKEENLPGVNIDAEESLSKNIFKGIGYTLVEQATYGISQSIRFYTDFKEEFDPATKKGFSKLAYAKSLANVINERFFPGHIFLGASSAISTYVLGKFIPKTTAAAIGEFPMATLNRIINCGRRRATKKAYDGAVIKNNFRFNLSSTFNGFLKAWDAILNPCRKAFVKSVAKLFNVSLDELQRSFNMSDQLLIEHYEEERKQKSPLSSGVIQEKAAA